MNIFTVIIILLVLVIIYLLFSSNSCLSLSEKYGQDASVRVTTGGIAGPEFYRKIKESEENILRLKSSYPLLVSNPGIMNVDEQDIDCSRCK